MTRWSLFLQTLSLLHYFLGLYFSVLLGLLYVAANITLRNYCRKSGSSVNFLHNSVLSFAIPRLAFGLLSDKHFSVDGTLLNAWVVDEEFSTKGGGRQSPPRRRLICANLLDANP